MDCDVIDVNSALDDSAKALTAMCMEVTCMCRLLGLSHSPCFGQLSLFSLLTCSGRASVTATNVTFLQLKHYCKYENTSTCFSKDAESLKTYGCVL